jgi:uncharacterized SAM-binding protein YcdF (DUF218 family)
MKKKTVFILFFLGIVLFAVFAGRLLVADWAERSDAIVVLAGDSMDIRYARGMELLHQGYGKHLFLDASADTHFFGKTPAEYASAFLKQEAGDMSDKVSVCPFAQDSTMTETIYVQKCLSQSEAKSVLLVTSDFHSRRALSIFRKKLPQYHWSVAAARDPDMFGVRWWQHREWTKTAFYEWLKTLWWNGIDRWR